MNRFLLILFSIFFSIKGFAQMPNADETGKAKLRLREVENQPRSYVNDTLQIFYLNKICRNYTLLTRLRADSGLFYAEKL